MGKHHFILFFTLAFAFMVPGTMGNDTGIAELDDYTKQRAENAKKATMEAYNPHPELFTRKFATQVKESLRGANSTRRSLHSGECKAANPIDTCWRCKADWAQNRQALAQCALGFGQGTTGGMGGEIYVVTDPTDDDVANPKPGTLRYGVIQDRPLWIIFGQSMIIQLKQELLINNNKTIDGRGESIQIAYGAGLTIQCVSNVIVHGIHIHHIVEKEGGMIRDTETHSGQSSKSDGDGIAIKTSSKIWIDHVTLDNCKDGLLDATVGSTAITVSNCKFNHHSKVMLLGADDTHSQDQFMQVTVAFNHFGKGCVQRLPRCRWGFFHVINNDYHEWEMYAIGGSMHPTIISQGNRFKALDDPKAKQVTQRNNAPEEEWKHWNWRSENDLFLNGAYFVTSGHDVQVTAEQKDHMLRAEIGSDVGRLTHDAGAFLCVPGKPC